MTVKERIYNSNFDHDSNSCNTQEEKMAMIVRIYTLYILNKANLTNIKINCKMGKLADWTKVRKGLAFIYSCLLTIDTILLY